MDKERDLIFLPIALGKVLCDKVRPEFRLTCDLAFDTYEVRKLDRLTRIHFDIEKRESDARIENRFEFEVHVLVLKAVKQLSYGDSDG